MLTSGGGTMHFFRSRPCLHPSDLVLLLVLVFAAAGLRAETVLLSDTFDAENGGNFALNYAGLTNFTVVSGALDLIGNGNFDFYPGNGLYLDLDGTSNAAARIESTSTFALAAGQAYRLTFDLGNTDERFGSSGINNTMTVSLGGAFSEQFNRDTPSDFVTVVRHFVAGVDESAVLAFDHQGGDNLGLLVDNVNLTAVPVPAMAGVFGFCAAMALSARQRGRGQRPAA